MILVLFTVIGSLAVWGAGRTSSRLARWVYGAVLGVDLIAGLAMLSYVAGGDAYLLQDQDWIPSLGISLSVAVGSLSAWMILLTAALGLVALAVPTRVQYPGSFWALLLASQAALLGMFLADNLLVFFVFYEIMLLPIFVLLLMHGVEERPNTALRFLVFTQAGGLLMLVSIVTLYLLHGNATGTYTFESTDLLDTPLSLEASTWIALGFFLAFAVKLPLVPLHMWQADTYKAAPLPVNVILAGVMAKAGGYGLLRFAAPLAHEGMLAISPFAMFAALVTILYGSVLAVAQYDFKRFIAYSSMAHLGFVVLGVFSDTDVGAAGALLQMLSHGVSVAGLFFIAGVLEKAGGTGDMRQFSGLWARAPRLGAFALAFGMATVGLPGFGNFLGEFLSLMGAFTVHPVLAGLGAIGAVLAAVYVLRWLRDAFFGEPLEGQGLVPELNLVQTAVASVLIAVLLWLGVTGTAIAGMGRPALEITEQAAVAAAGEQR